MKQHCFELLKQLIVILPIRLLYYRLPNTNAWISTKYLNENSVHEHLTSSLNPADGKLKINVPPNYQYVSHTNLSLVLKHVSGLKVVFVAPTKAHKVHEKGVLSVTAAENALAVSSCEGDKVVVWDSRTSEFYISCNYLQILKS